MNDFIGRHERIHRLNRSLTGQPTREGNAFASVALVGFGIFIVMIALAALRACETRPASAQVQSAVVSRQCGECHTRKWNMTRYFERKNHATPEAMAEAVLSTQSPRLLAAMNTAGEKCTPYTSRRGGFRKAHAGAWQINERLHRLRVPENPVDQALQAERLLSQLTNEMPIRQALSTWGGDSTDAYQKRVLAELVRVP